TESTNATENRIQQQQNNKNEQQTSSTVFNQGPPPITSLPANSSQFQYENRQQDVADDSNKLRFKQEIDRLKNENENLKEKLTQQENTLRQRTPGSDHAGNPVADQFKRNQQQQKGLVLFGITLNEQLVLITFVALLFGFALGYFLRRWQLK
ncbi:unnamed protein product, partial [Rotaria sp. Silwood1]